MNEGDDSSDLAAERARIHHQPTADGTGNSFAKFETLEATLNHGFDQRAEIDARARDNFHIIDRNLIEAVAEPNHQTSNPAIADQQVGPMTEAKSRHAGATRRGLGAHQLGFVLDGDKQVRRAADSKRGEFRE